MSSRGLLSGAKCTDSHSTLTDEARVVVAAAKGMNQVRRVVLGRIRNNGAKRRLRFKRLSGGLKAIVHGDGVQEVLIYTDAPEAVEAEVQQRWEREYG